MKHLHEPERDMVREPDGAWFDPTASILDPARAAARRPWPHDLLPKDYLITSGLYQRFMAAPIRSAEPDMAHPTTSHTLPDRTTAPTTLFDLDEPDQADPACDPGAEQAPTGDPAGDAPGGPVAPQQRPPSNPQLKKKYYALRAKANTVRGQHPRQANILDAQADALMESVPTDTPWHAPRGVPHADRTEAATRRAVGSHEVGTAAVWRVSRWLQPEHRQPACWSLPHLPRWCRRQRSENHLEQPRRAPPIHPRR